MNEPKSKLRTTQLLTMIRKTSNFSRVDKAIHDSSEPAEFCHYLYELMSEKDLKAKDIVNEAGMERSYFYHILSGKKIPSRNIVIRIGLCMNASLNEMNKMLLLSQQGTLYPKIRRDAAIIYCIDKKYSMSETNDFLTRLGEAPLYKEM